MPQRFFWKLFVLILLMGPTAILVPAVNAEVSPISTEKIYVALEGEGRVGVLDPAGGVMFKKIDLSEGGVNELKYMAHNVQVSPNGKSVWVTANVEAGGGEMDMGGGKMKAAEHKDEVIIINPVTDVITARIPLAFDAHLAHVVISPDGRSVYVTAQEKGWVYKIDSHSRKVVKTYQLGPKTGPHGLRMSPDGKRVYVALLAGKGLAIIDTTKNTIAIKKLTGMAVQTAVTPDGRLAFTSIYDKKQIAVYQIASKKISYINLPKESRGPVQIYSSPDSKFLYVADQGFYFDQPTGNMVYVIDIAKKAVIKTYTTGEGPHGLVSSKDGARLYVTNIVSDDVSIIDLKKGEEIHRIKVGDMPNGISVWNK